MTHSMTKFAASTTRLSLMAMVLFGTMMVVGATSTPAADMMEQQQLVEKAKMTLEAFAADQSVGGPIRPSHDTQYFEIFGNRAIYHDGWLAGTTPAEGPWLMGLDTAGCGKRLQLGALQHRRGLLSGRRPRHQDARQAARDAGTLPGRGIEIRRVSARQLCYSAGPRTATEPTGRQDRLYVLGGISGIPPGSTPNLLGKSYSVSAEIEIPQGGAEGMLKATVAHSAAMASIW